ncbi:MAG: outer membrane beta-barrel protein [Paludibacter sp.]|jgi:hypothetical protein|nr:outer membrane beta-barrel protein [Paludibacter sp.]
MNRTVSILILLFAVMVANAQFDLGIKAGYNSSLGFNNLNMIGDRSYTLENVKSEMKNNFHAGIFARAYINKFYIQPEILYSIQKKEYDMVDVMIGGEMTNVETYMDISTVVVPVFLGYKLLDLKIAALRIFGGPKFIMNAGSTLEFKNLTSQQISAANLLQDFKESQVDVELGAALDIVMFSVEAKMNVIKDAEALFRSQTGIRNMPVPTSNFIISLAWTIF